MFQAIALKWGRIVVDFSEIIGHLVHSGKHMCQREPLPTNYKFGGVEYTLVYVGECSRKQATGSFGRLHGQQVKVAVMAPRYPTNCPCCPLPSWKTASNLLGNHLSHIRGKVTLT